MCAVWQVVPCRKRMSITNWQAGSITHRLIKQLFPDKNAERKFGRKGLSRNVYRFGWHFPTDVILKAMESTGLKSQDDVYATRNPLATKEHKPSEKDVTDHNLAELILDLFPRIPENDINNIIKHAFERVLY
jgi:hypothetical protein